MRESVYISDGKLAQFMPDAPPPRWRRKLSRAEVKTPLGSVGIDAAEAPADDTRARRLYQAIRDIEVRAKWYEESSLKAGEWIFFETRLMYLVIDLDEIRPSRYGKRAAGDGTGKNEAQPMAVLFAGLDGPTDLILHGSAEHLIGHQISVSTDSRRIPPSSAMWLRRFLEITASSEKVLGPRSASSGIDLRGGPSLQPDMSLYHPDPMSTEMLRNVHRYIGSMRSTAAMMAGYARVTMQPGGDPQIVVATPLFVEYTRDVSSL